MTQMWTGDKPNPGPQVSAAIWAPYVTIAGMDTQAVTYPGNETTQQLSALGLKVMPYTDPNHFVSGVIGKGVGVDSYFIDSDIARACDGTKIQVVHPGQVQNPYLIDPRSPHVAVAWNAWLSNFVLVQKKVLNLVFEDTADNTTFAYDRPSAPCETPGGNTIVKPAEWTAATAKNEAALQAPVMFNGLATTGSDAVNLLNGPAVGGMAEACFSDWLHIAPSDPGPYTPSQTSWLASMTIEIAAKAAGKIFDCQATASAHGDSANAIAYRLFMIASLDLDADVPNLIVSWRFYTPNRVPIFPEASLIVEDPLVADPLKPTDLLIGATVYGREYRHCYISGREIVATNVAAVGSSGCAIVVNANGRKSYPNPLASGYKRTLVLTGSGVLDGGTMSVAAIPPPATLAPSSAEIEFR